MTQLPPPDKKPVLIIVHRADSEAGRVGHWFDHHDQPYQICRLALGHQLPTTLADYAGVVIFGGPMSVNDHPDVPFLDDEIRWLPTILDDGVPVMGLCLGAQLIAHALGGIIAPRPDGRVEVGYTEITPTPQGLETGLFPKPMHAFQWHQDGITLPAADPDIKHLAGSDGFPVQAFMWKNHVLGVQFHPEVTRAMWHRWIIRARDMMDRPGAQQQKAQLDDRLQFDNELKNWLDRTMPAWLNGTLLTEIRE